MNPVVGLGPAQLQGPHPTPSVRFAGRLSPAGNPEPGEQASSTSKSYHLPTTCLAKWGALLPRVLNLRTPPVEDITVALQPVRKLRPREVK